MDDKDEQWQAAERLALVLTENGMQRMLARTLAVFLFTDAEAVTMGEIGDRLGVSAGSVSGSVRGLLSVGLIERIPAPGSRREHYRMRADAWPRLFTTQNAAVDAMMRAAESAIATTTAGDPAHARLTRMRDFYQFLMGELPSLLRRWEEQRAPR